MKKFIMLAVLGATLTGCSMAEHASQFCDADSEPLCRFIFGDKDREQDKRLDDVEARIEMLEEDTALLFQQLFFLYLNDYENAAQLSYLNTQIAVNTAELAELKTNHNIVGLVDPCGDGPGFDEVLLRTSTGKLVASFSDTANGKNTRFTVLTPGSYQTTDGTGCVFTVDSAGVVSPATEI